MNMLGRNPVLWGALFRASLVVVTAFGLHLSADQIAALLLLSECAIALWTNSATMPTVQVDQHVADRVAVLNSAGNNPASFGGPTRLPLVVLAIAAGSLMLATSCAKLLPPPQPTPETDQQRAAFVLAQVQNANTLIKTVRGTQKLVIALGPAMQPQTAIDIQKGFKVFYGAADVAFVVAGDTSKPLTTRTEAIASIIAHADDLIRVLDAGPAEALSDMLDALRSQLARVRQPVLVTG